MDWWCLLMLTALLCCVKDINAVSYNLYINDSPVTPSNAVQTLSRQATITLTCRINPAVVHSTLVRVVNGQEQQLANAVNKITVNQMVWTYDLESSDKATDGITYRCKDNANVPCPNYVQVTIYFGTTQGSPGPTLPNCLPGGTIDVPSVSPSSSPSNNLVTRPGSGGGGNNTKFAGLNPLIYTISAVILLGTLAIIAIITCWIRARRSYNRRMFQATTNPQDYLDYISDNEFTPLTTSEFVASLQERPPTYHESEEIEEQMRPKSSDEENEEGGEGGNGEGSGTGDTSQQQSAAAGTTSSSSRTRVPPPRPPPPTSSNSPQPNQPSQSTGTTSGGTQADERTSETNPPALVTVTLECAADEEDDTYSSLVNGDNIPDVTEDPTVTGASSGEPILTGVDALFAVDFGIVYGNGTRQESQLGVVSQPMLSSESVPTGTLIDLGDSSVPTTSDSQSTFHSLPQPTPEQIIEIEAAIGALNERMTRIRERTE